MAFRSGKSPGAGSDTTRLEAFSDGVIAIAITLLVLEIRVPEDAESVPALWNALRDLWPAYLGYLISFATIGIMWANHHTIFRLITRTNHYLILTNLLFLLCLAFLPAPTALLTHTLGHADERVYRLNPDRYHAARRVWMQTHGGSLVGDDDGGFVRYL